MKARHQFDYVVVGGGFYGCALALFLRSLSARVVLIEAGDRLMQRASRVNQARIHTGFHYPRSPLTAVKSLVLHQRFADDFPTAVVDDYQMLYAVARRRSRITAQRFHRMFSEMGAPMRPATAEEASLFSSDSVEAVFACTERAFDYSVLLAHFERRLPAEGVQLMLATEVTRLAEERDLVTVGLAGGMEIASRYVFNVTYAHLNAVLRSARLPEAELKHELTEIALVEPPSALRGYGITVVDGPFFSMMPSPAERLHSLSHVRYTPHRAWTDQSTNRSPYEVLAAQSPESHHRQMILDAERYVPAMRGVVWKRSLYEVKTVLQKNEKDDGRPILFHRKPAGSRVISTLGGKIDNIYDLFDLIRASEPQWARAHANHLFA